MPDNEKEKKQDIWELKSGDKVIFVGTYEDCKAEWQRLHEKQRKEFHDKKADRQLKWQQRGGKDDERDRC